MSETKRTIEAGIEVKFQHEGMLETFGVVVEKEESKWGTSYKILKDDGEVTWTSEIREPGSRSVNGSPLGCYFVD